MKHRRIAVWCGCAALIVTSACRRDTPPAASYMTARDWGGTARVAATNDALHISMPARGVAETAPRTLSATGTFVLCVEVGGSVHAQPGSVVLDIRSGQYHARHYLFLPGSGDGIVTNMVVFRYADSSTSLTFRLSSDAPQAFFFQRCDVLPVQRNGVWPPPLVLDARAAWDYRSALCTISNDVLHCAPSGRSDPHQYLYFAHVQLWPRSYYRLALTMRAPVPCSFGDRIFADIFAGAHFDPPGLELVVHGLDLDRHMRSHTVVVHTPTNTPLYALLRVVGHLHAPAEIAGVRLERIPAWRYWAARAWPLGDWRALQWRVLLPCGLALLCMAALYLCHARRYCSRIAAWPRAAVAVIVVLLIMLVLLACGSSHTALEWRVFMRVALIAATLTWCGWWCAVLLAPRAWRPYALSLAPVCGVLVCGLGMLALQHVAHLQVRPALLVLAGASAVLNAALLWRMRASRATLGRENILPLAAAVLAWWCLLAPMHTRPPQGLYSDCIDGLLYCTGAAYVQEQPRVEDTWYGGSINYASMLMQWLRRPVTACSLGLAATLTRTEPHEVYRPYLALLCALATVLVFCITRGAFNTSRLAACLAACIAATSPVAAFVCQNNSLGQALFQLMFLLAMGLMLQALRTGGIVHWLVACMLSALALVCTRYTYAELALPYFALWLCAGGAGWACGRLPRALAASIGTLCVALSLLFLIVHARGLLPMHLVPAALKPFLDPNAEWGSGDIQLMMNPLFITNVFDYVSRALRFTVQGRAPILPAWCAKALGAAICVLAASGVWHAPRRIRGALIGVIAGMTVMYLYLRINLGWAYGLRKHLGVCVLLFGPCLACGFDYCRTSQRRLLRGAAIAVCGALLAVGALNVCVTGLSLASWRDYFSDPALALMRALDTHVPRTASFYYHAPETRLWYLLRHRRYAKVAPDYVQYALLTDITPAQPGAWWHSASATCLFENASGRIMSRVPAPSGTR